MPQKDGGGGGRTRGASAGTEVEVDGMGFTVDRDLGAVDPARGAGGRSEEADFVAVVEVEALVFDGGDFLLPPVEDSLVLLVSSDSRVVLLPTEVFDPESVASLALAGPFHPLASAIPLRASPLRSSCVVVVRGGEAEVPSRLFFPLSALPVPSEKLSSEVKMNSRLRGNFFPSSPFFSKVLLTDLSFSFPFPFTFFPITSTSEGLLGGKPRRLDDPPSAVFFRL